MWGTCQLAGSRFKNSGIVVPASYPGQGRMGAPRFNIPVLPSLSHEATIVPLKVMRPLYAVQFEVEGREGGIRADLATEVLKTVAVWISDWYLTRKTIQISFPLTSGAISPILNHDVNVAHDVSIGASISHTTVTWSYPDENDGNLFWHSRAEIGEFNGLVEFSLQLFLDSTQYLIAPVELRSGDRVSLVRC